MFVCCQLRLGENVIFSAANYDRGLISSVQVPLTYEQSIYSVNFLSIGVGQATKDINVYIEKLEIYWLLFTICFLWWLNIYSITHFVRLSTFKFLFFQISFATYGCCHPRLLFKENMKQEVDGLSQVWENIRKLAWYGIPILRFFFIFYLKL